MVPHTHCPLSALTSCSADLFFLLQEITQRVLIKDTLPFFTLEQSWVLFPFTLYFEHECVCNMLHTLTFLSSTNNLKLNLKDLSHGRDLHFFLEEDAAILLCANHKSTARQSSRRLFSRLLIISRTKPELDSFHFGKSFLICVPNMKIQKNKTWMDLQPDDSVWFLNVCWMHRVKIHLLDGLDYIIKHIWCPCC